MYSVLFDIDGTLVQTGGAGKNAFAAAFAQLFDVVEISNNVQFAGRSDRAIALDLMGLHGVEPSVENWQRFVDCYLEQLEISLPKCEGEVLTGVVDLLDALQGIEQVQLGLLTGNVKSGAAHKLGHYNLADRFAFGGFGDEETDRNAIARVAKAQAQAHAEGDLARTMVIGDTVHDVVCAQSIGAFAVAVATGGATIEELAKTGPDLLLEDLTDTEALLTEVMASDRREVKFS
ncbi:MAG: HAD hydrolase-like protein [Planctomycetes bacterium]|nr:HAD hydrolase-like protein [Planctomycetota bacterium]